jgi:hypothetical protein
MVASLLAVQAAQVVRWGVWAGLVVITAALLVLARTRWGQSQPLGKCMVLSLLAHLLLALYATTVSIMTGAGSSGSGGELTVSIVDGFDGGTTLEESVDTWDGLPAANGTLDAPAVRDELPVPDVALPERQVPAVQPALPDTAPTPLPAEPPGRAAEPQPPSATPAETIDTQPAARRATPADDVPAPPDSPISDAPGNDAALPRPIADLPITSIPDLGPVDRADDAAVSSGAANSTARGTGRPAPAGSDGGPSASSTTASPRGTPSVYSLRTSGDRGAAARRNGGSPDTEAAVEAALRWLAARQSRDGRWPPQSLEAGRGAIVLGQDRRGVGARADTGIAGLALLAFLAAGNTHEQGPYARQVQHGLEYLLSMQTADGSLAGRATLYERMYCHAMAAFALSEAYAMTGDDRLRPAVTRAVQFTVQAQDRSLGGWRYEPGKDGDTSQLGWQVMFLKSAELAGIPIAASTRAGIERFLGSVASGRNQGLAAYRPGHGPSRAMTAEALVCRQFLGLRADHPLTAEAAAYLLGEPPGEGEDNHYYWYYGTLAMFQAQGPAWQKWNEALQRRVLTTQRRGGDLDGSWDPDQVWGHCGGRVFSTALCTLCLEVYYRYLPLYVEAAALEKRSK